MVPRFFVFSEKKNTHKKNNAQQLATMNSFRCSNNILKADNCPTPDFSNKKFAQQNKKCNLNF